VLSDFGRRRILRRLVQHIYFALQTRRNLRRPESDDTGPNRWPRMTRLRAQQVAQNGTTYCIYAITILDSQIHAWLQNLSWRQCFHFQNIEFGIDEIATTFEGLAVSLKGCCSSVTIPSIESLPLSPFLAPAHRIASSSLESRLQCRAPRTTSSHGWGIRHRPRVRCQRMKGHS
jgi:hypothetical protein